MDMLRQYFLSVTAAALICGIVTGLLGKKGTAAAFIKLIAGMFLAFTVINPLARLEWDRLTDYVDDISVDSSAAVGAGTAAAQNAFRDGIKAQTEAYILDKAAAWDAGLTVEVSLSNTDPPVPVAVFLSGQVSPYAKAQLAQMMEQELGISKEDQIWTP